MRHKWIGVPLVLFALAAASLAQQSYPKVTSTGNEYNHGEFGAFLNYTRLHNADDTNFYGLGGRIAFHVGRNVQMEAEGAYDFQQNTDVQIDLGGGNFVSQRSPLRIAHFLFGPRFQWGTSSPVRVFVTAKGGLMDFSTDTNFGSQVTSIPTNATEAVFYPGGGIEFFAGALGARFEAGDEMYFNNGANHNLRITAGPVFRF
jgi:hypothetical protein